MIQRTHFTGNVRRQRFCFWLVAILELAEALIEVGSIGFFTANWAAHALFGVGKLGRFFKWLGLDQ